MSGPESKRRRLADIIGLKRISGTALAALVKSLVDEPLAPLSEYQIGAAINKEFSRVSHCIKVPLDDGTFDWEVCRLDTLLAYFCEECEPFRKSLIAALVIAAGSPLDAIVYLDEVTPGNILRPDNQRKFWAIYISFRNFGADLLCREELWLPIAMIRTTVVHRIPGGISHAMRLLLRSIFVEPCKFASVGVALQLDVPRLATGRLSNLIADESALKSVLCSKGAAGIRPCAICRNIVMLGSNLTEGQDYLKEISCSDAAAFDKATDQDIWDAFDLLRRQKPTMAKSAFQRVERAAGFTFHEQSLLGDLELRAFVKPASAHTMDWMHNILVNGICSIEFHAFLHRCRSVLGTRIGGTIWHTLGATVRTSPLQHPRSHMFFDAAHKPGKH